MIITVKNRSDVFCWHLIVVHGTTYAVDEVEFIVELYDTMGSLSYVVWWRLYLVREAKDKSSGVVNNSWLSFLFNDWINKWTLMETKLANRVYTWSNNQYNLIIATIDRVLSSTNWDIHFPLTTLCALPRVRSDHAPLLLDTDVSRRCAYKTFRFEKWWLGHLDFVILSPWFIKSGPLRPPFLLQLRLGNSKLNYLDRKLKGGVLIWNLIWRKERKKLYSRNLISWMFSQSKTCPLLRISSGWEKSSLCSRIFGRKKRLSYGSSRDRKILEGDRNTTYFHDVANQHRRKNHLFVLDGPVTPLKICMRLLLIFIKKLFLVWTKT